MPKKRSLTHSLKTVFYCLIDSRKHNSFNENLYTIFYPVDAGSAWMLLSGTGTNPKTHLANVADDDATDNDNNDTGLHNGCCHTQSSYKALPGGNHGSGTD
jgi:hypothetical protein